MSDKTSDSSANYVLLTKLADEFAARYRAGERPSLQEYVDRHPGLADDIRELFPAMVEIEQAGEAHHETAQEAVEPAAPALQQLGDFRIIREVGKGGMGIVYEAEQVSLGRHVALKVLPKSMLIDVKAKRRFEREAKSAAKLHHTNIVPVFGVGEQDGLPYYVMQFIQGLGLDEVLEELKKLQLGNARTGTFAGGELRVSRTVGQATKSVGAVAGGLGDQRQTQLSAVNVARSLMTGEFQPRGEPVEESEQNQGADAPRSPALSDSFTLSSSSVVLPGRSRDSSKSRSRKQTYWQSVASIGVQVAEALEYAHKQGIHHRDIKPSNLLLDTQGTVWVTDFGLAKADDQQNLTHTGDILGTLRYMPPEAFDAKTDARSDIYSLGLTLYEMLAFRPAFDERERNRLIKQVTSTPPVRLGKLNRQLPRDLETIVHKAIDRETGQRYQTAAALAADLQRFIDDEPIQARRVGATERLRRWCRHNPALAASLGIAAAALLAVTVVSTYFAVAQTEFAAQQARSNEELSREQVRTKTALEESKTLGVELDSKLRELRKTSALAAVERGQSLIDQGHIHRGLLWLTRGLELAPAEQGDLQHAIRTSLASFRGEIPILRATFPGPYPIFSISPDGKTVAIGGADRSGRGRAQLWDIASGKRAGPALPHRGFFVHSLAFSPDGKTLLTGSTDGTARLWDVATGKPLTIPPLKHQGGVRAASFSPDGKTIFTAGYGGFVRLWDAATGHPLDQKLPEPGYVAAFSPDGKSLLAGGGWSSAGRNETHLWDLGTGKARNFQHTEALTVAFGPDGKIFATGGNGTTARLWDVATGKSVGKLLEHQAPVYALAFSPDGRTLLTAGGGVVRLWDVDTGESSGEPLEASSGYFCSAAFSSDGQNILIPGPDQDAWLWSLPPGRQTRVPLPQPGVVSGLEYSRDGKSLLVASGDSTNAEVRLWDPAAGKPMGPSLKNPGYHHPVVLGPDGRTIVAKSGGMSTSLRILDVIAGKPIGEPLTFLSVTHLAFSQDGKTILVGSLESNQGWSAQLVDATSGKVIVPLVFKFGVASAMALSSDGKIILTGSIDPATQSAEVQRWDTRTGKALGSALRHQGSVVALAFSPNDKIILSGSQDRTARFWDAATGNPMGLPLLHRGAVNAVAFSPDSKIAATAGDDQMVRLWDVGTGLPLGAPLRHQGAVHAVSFSPDGTTLVTGGADKMVHFWQVPLPLPGEVAQLKAAVELAGGMTLSPEGVTTPLPSPANGGRQVPDSSSLRDPVNPLDRAPDEALSWHLRQALDLVAAEKWPAALWHLDRQIRSQPNDWLAHVLRSKVNLQLDRLDMASADLASAFDQGPADQVLNWYACFAAERVDKEQWQAALWCFDRMIERSPKAASPYVQRARALVKMNRWQEAAADYSRAVALSPGESQLWLEKADLDFAHGQWQDAARAYSAVVNLDPEDHWGWYQCSALHLYIGDIAAYQRDCREMLKRFGHTTNPVLAERTAKTCLLWPDVADQKLVQKLAELAVTNTEKHTFRQAFLLAKGLAEFRAGNPRTSINMLRASLKNIGIGTVSDAPFNSLANLFIAMSYHRLGQDKDARQALQQARTVIDTELERWKQENAWKGNADWLRSMSVLREAEALIDGKKNP